MLFGTLNVVCIIYEYLTFTISFYLYHGIKIIQEWKNLEELAYYLIFTKPVWHPVARAKWSIFCRRHSQMHITKIIAFLLKFHWILFPRVQFTKDEKKILTKKCIWKCCLQNVGHFIAASFLLTKIASRFYRSIHPIEENLANYGDHLNRIASTKCSPWLRNPMTIFSVLLAFWGPSHYDLWRHNSKIS